MNFLKVKNCLLIFLISFFISIGFVRAETLTGEIHTTNVTREKYKNSINLFEESSKYTKFIQLLYNQGYNLGNYLNDFYNIGDNCVFNDQYKYGISILNVADLSFFTNFRHSHHDSSTAGLQYNITDYNDFINHLFTNNTSSFTRYHTINYLGDYTFSDVSKLIFISTRTTSDSTSYGVFHINEEYSSLSLFPKYIFLINDIGENIGYIKFNIGTSGCWGNGYNANYYSSLGFRFPHDLNSPGVTYDMTSWYAYSYKLNSNSGFFDLIYPYSFYINGEKVVVKDNAGYSGVKGWFNNLFYSHIDFSEWNFNFIYDDVFYKYGINFIPLLDRWYDSSSYVVPDGYSRLDISTSEKGYYLVPKGGCSASDYRIYFSSASTISDFKLLFNYYKYVDSNLKFYKSFHTSSSKSYSIYSYQPLTDLGVTLEDYLNFALNINQSSLRYPYNVYYNSNCYSSNLSSNSDITLDFESGQIIVDNSTQQDFYNNTVSNNSSVNSTGSSNNNVNNNIDFDVDFDVDSILKNITSYVSGISGSIKSLVSITTIFLTGLPPMIYNFLFSVFSIGMIIFIIKLFK